MQERAEWKDSTGCEEDPGETFTGLQIHGIRRQTEVLTDSLPLSMGHCLALGDPGNVHFWTFQFCDILN